MPISQRPRPAFRARCSTAAIRRALVALLAAMSLLPLTLSAPSQAAGANPRQARRDLAATVTWPLGPSGPISATDRPNVIIVLTDDQRADTLRYAQPLQTAMPAVSREIMSKGVTIDDFATLISWCCPSRAMLQKGAGPELTGVWENGGANGGYLAFKRTMASTIATWMHDAGYRTALVGKSFNGYDCSVPPGWDVHLSFTNTPGANEGGAYGNYTLCGTSRETHGNTVADYSTDVLADRMSSFIRSTPATKPVFGLLSVFGPHAPATPAPGDDTALSTLSLGAPANHCEADVSDKPLWVRQLAACTKSDARFSNAMKGHYRPLMSVDDAVAQQIQALKDTGRLANTMVVLLGDNGYSRSEHRWSGKQAGYEEDMRIPFLLRYDRLTANRAGQHISGKWGLMTDVAPTVAEVAGVVAPSYVTGHSLVPLLRADQTSWRAEFPIAHLRGSGGKDPVPSFCGIRTDSGTRYKYMALQTGEEELYDLSADPYELQNQAANPAYSSVKTTLRARTKAVCPPPPGYSFPY